MKLIANDRAALDTGLHGLAAALTKYDDESYFSKTKQNLRIAPYVVTKD